MKRIISLALICSIAVMLLSSFSFVSADSTDLSSLITYDAPDNAFDYYIEGDPQDITDEEFFGKWNSEGEMWSLKPYLSYDKFEGLAFVEEAAKEGDYATAKDELLKYYRSIREERVLDVSAHPGKRPVLQAEALGKNLYTTNGSQCGYIQDIVTFNNEWEEFRVDVTSSFTSRTAGYIMERGFAFISVDKFLTQAEIKAKESGSPARLEMVINGGVPITIYASKDAYTRGGMYSGENYGGEDVLRVQSSGQYKKFDENTFFSYIAFDISFLKTTDTIDSVTLVFEGRNASGTGDKEIVVYRQNNTNYNENDINHDLFASECLFWSCNDMNTWDYIASENTTLKGKACFYHRGNELDAIAQLYSYTKNEEYAFTYLRQHMGLVNSVGFDISCYNELDLGTHTAAASKDTFYILDSEYMTGDMLTGIIKNIWLQADYLVNVYYGSAYNNWGSFATQGVYSFLSRFREMEVYDEWFAKTVKENTRLVGGFAMADGMCVELPLGYISTLLGTISGPITISQETGNVLPYEDIVMKQAHDIVQTAVYATGPDFRGFNMSESNDYSTTMKNTITTWYNTVFTDDPEFEYVATNGVSGKLPDNPTTHYPVGLRTYMRSAWADPDALVMAFTAKGNGSHGQLDRLSIAMYAYGEFLLTDQAYGASLTDGTQEFMASTGQHNAVTINGKTQLYQQKDGVEEAFESNSLYDFIEYSGEFYTEAAQQRSVMYLKNQKFWIVTDFADPYNDTETISYEQNWHMLPAANMTLDPETHVMRSHMETANVLVIPVDIEGVTSSREYAMFSPMSGSFIETKKAVLKQEATGNSKFTTLVIPMNANDDFDVDVMTMSVGEQDDLANAFNCKITNLTTGEVNYYYYYHHNQPENKKPVRLGNYETDATTMMMQLDKDKKFVSMFLMDATYLNDDSLGTENVRFKSNTPVGAISYEETGEMAKLYSSTLTDASQLDDLTVYVGNKKNAKLNGEFTDGKKSGGYLYFGDTPIITGSELPEQDTGSNDTTTNGGNHGTGGTIVGGTGGSGGGGGGGGSAPVVTPPADDVQQPTTPDVVTPPVDITPTVPSNISNELEGHWGEDLIKSLYEDGIITGDDNGLRLKDSISRAEFTALIVRALNLETSEYNNTFTDVRADDWYAAYIATAHENGLVSGADGMFRPTDTITREEICKIISSASKAETQLGELDFTDIDEISTWALDSVKKAYSLGIINGMDNGSFAPKSNALREQAFVILARLLEIN